MWIAKTKQFESVKLFVPSKVLMFSGKPTLAPNGYWYCLDTEGKVIEYGTEIPSNLTPYSDVLKEGDCVEVIILPTVTRQEILYENPVYKAIIDYGIKLRDNKIGDDVLDGESGRRFEYCKNCGHPWCETGTNCMYCEEWHFDIDRLITKMKGQF